MKSVWSQKYQNGSISIHRYKEDVIPFSRANQGIRAGGPYQSRVSNEVYARLEQQAHGLWVQKND